MTDVNVWQQKIMQHFWKQTQNFSMPAAAAAATLDDLF